VSSEAVGGEVEQRTTLLSFALQGVCGSSSALPFDDFLWIFGENVLVFAKQNSWKCIISKKLGVHVTGRPDCSGLSRREVRIDVWKYL